MADSQSSPFLINSSSPTEVGTSYEEPFGMDSDHENDVSVHLPSQLSDSNAEDTFIDTSEIEVEFALTGNVSGTSSDETWKDAVDNLKDLTVRFQTQFPPLVCPWAFMSHEERYQRVVGQIERVLLSQIRNGLVQGETELSFTYPDYSDWSCVKYHPGYGLLPNMNSPKMVNTRLENRGSAAKYSLIVLTLWSILELFDQDSFVTKRELYYQHINDYRSQGAVDECVNVIACMLQIPRLQLRILSTSKGLFMGNIVFHNAQDIQVIGSHPTPVPQDITGISKLTSEAKFILVVEKDAVFQRLADDNFAVKYQPCLVITGKGVPDLNTRQFLFHLWTHLKVPVLALMDGDPFGIEILCTYRFGSLPMTWCQEHLPVPTMKWIGVFPSDLEHFPTNHLKSLSKLDGVKIKSLLLRPYIVANPELQQEILILQKRGLKAEIEAVDSIGDYVIHQIISEHWL